MEITHTNSGSYNTEKKSALLINILYIMSVLVISSISALFIPETNALQAEYTIKLCERTAYGANYVESRKKTCDIIWQKMSYEVLSTNQ
jgi:hypothetical protein